MSTAYCDVYIHGLVACSLSPLSQGSGSWLQPGKSNNAKHQADLVYFYIWLRTCNWINIFYV